MKTILSNTFLIILCFTPVYGFYKTSQNLIHEGIMTNVFLFHLSALFHALGICFTIMAPIIYFLKLGNIFI